MLSDIVSRKLFRAVVTTNPNSCDTRYRRASFRTHHVDCLSESPAFECGGTSPRRPCFASIVPPLEARALVVSEQSAAARRYCSIRVHDRACRWRPAVSRLPKGAQRKTAPLTAHGHDYQRDANGMHTPKAAPSTSTDRRAPFREPSQLGDAGKRVTPDRGRPVPRSRVSRDACATTMASTPRSRPCSLASPRCSIPELPRAAREAHSPIGFPLFRSSSFVPTLCMLAGL